MQGDHCSAAADSFVPQQRKWKSRCRTQEDSCQPSHWLKRDVAIWFGLAASGLSGAHLARPAAENSSIPG
ncbi:hypothetical protein F1880_004956 [Penicillium rolfsii]|nr:hypothetical protein F1880_004956 [Penicillium rolfsii]